MSKTRISADGERAGKAQDVSRARGIGNDGRVVPAGRDRVNRSTVSGLRRQVRSSWLACGATALVVALSASCGGDRAPGQQAFPPGRQVAERYGCTSCHSVDGSRRAGPSWLGLYGSEVKLADGTTVVADEAYLERSITEPSAQVVAGYPDSMPTRALSGDELVEVIAYLKSLGSGADKPEEPKE